MPRVLATVDVLAAAVRAVRAPGEVEVAAGPVQASVLVVASKQRRNDLELSPPLLLEDA